MTNNTAASITKVHEILASSAPPMSEDSLDRRAHGLGQCVSSGDVLPVLLGLAPSLPHWTQRVVVLRALAHAPPDQCKAAADIAALMLSDADLAVQCDAIVALVGIGTVEAMRSLALFLNDNDNSILRDHARDLLSH